MSRHIPVEQLSAWLAGDTSERDAAVARAHVAGCAACAELADGLRSQVAALRTLDRPEPPPTLWLAIDGALERAAEASQRRFWSWRSSLVGALAGAVAVAALVWGLAAHSDLRVAVALRAQISKLAALGGKPGAADPAGALAVPLQPGLDPLLAEAEQELDRAATSYAEAAARLRAILDREQALWDPEARARVAERLARLDEAIVHSRAVADRDPGDGAGAEMLFSAYRRQIDFLAEAVHRGSPAAGDGLH